MAKAKGVSLLLPTDVVIADKFAADANSKVVPASSIPDGWMVLDVGPDAIKTFCEALDTTFCAGGVSELTKKPSNSIVLCNNDE
ncbi:phosphoglycerate kinase, putative [Ricinus communis]|uniref:phosphoglycerate kinase n=1 Tax=Ricinus communis TaxID=3988 RepID=B9SHE4_RICCO|nr:phosphoglycerate kinase, putative [Ricinus communis]